MKAKVTYKKIISVIIIIMLIILTACSKSSQKPMGQQQSVQSGQQSDEVPTELTKLENNIELIIKTLGGPAAQVNEENKQGNKDNSSSQDQGGSESKGTDQEKQGGQSEQQGQGQQQNQSQNTSQKSKQPQDPMKKIISTISKMHYEWNDILPLAIKKGIKKDLVDKFDNSLNSLTNISIEKNKIKILVAANSLYAYIPDLYSLFNLKSSSEIKRMRYYSRNTILNSLSDDWIHVDSDIANFKSIWSLYKNGLSKEQHDIANKLDVSIYEFEKAVKQKNKALANIKGRIVFSNIEALEKASDNESNKGTQKGNSQSKSQSNDGQSRGGKSGGDQSSVYSYIKRLLDKLLKR